MANDDENEPAAEDSTEKFIYTTMKNRDLWTLDEGIGVHHNPYYCDPLIGPSYDQFADEVLCKLDLEIFIRAIEAGELIVKGYDEKKIQNWDYEKSIPIQYQDEGNHYSCQVEYWRDCYGRLKVNPFHFIEFVQKKELFPIPPELDYVKNIYSSGEVKYHWASENISDQAELKPLGLREEKTLLNIIGALLECTTGRFKDQEFSSETKLREFIDKQYYGHYGLKARTLAEKFALAKKELKTGIK